jgi:hypothetical protein
MFAFEHQGRQEVGSIESAGRDYAGGSGVGISRVFGKDKRQTWAHARHEYTAYGNMSALNDNGFVFVEEQFGHRGPADSRVDGEMVIRLLRRGSGFRVNNTTP